jgi:hypothetical protein
VNLLLIQSSCSGDYEDYRVLVCYAMQYGSILLTYHRIMLPPSSGSSVLKMEMAGSSKMAIYFYQVTWHPSAEDCTLLLEVMLM